MIVVPKKVWKSLEKMADNVQVVELQSSLTTAIFKTAIFKTEFPALCTFGFENWCSNWNAALEAKYPRSPAVRCETLIKSWGIPDEDSC